MSCASLNRAVHIWTNANDAEEFGCAPAVGGAGFLIGFSTAGLKPCHSEYFVPFSILRVIALARMSRFIGCRCVWDFPEAL